MLQTTDASVFEIVPLKVVTPIDQANLVNVVKDILDQRLSLTMRAGGTSLGGQAIGKGVVVDVSKHLTQVIDFQPEKSLVKVEPGVIQDDLNRFVASAGLVFAPDTSTSNRAMIGGMIGNNSCGSYSVYYGTTREHVVEIEAILADGTEATFKPLTADELAEKLKLQTLEGKIYREILDILQANQDLILQNSPDASIVRRNTGYALDVLLREHQPFNPSGKPFNLAPLICGSEGTLAVVKTATLNLVKRPKFRQMLCAHFDSIDAALGKISAQLEFKPAAIELLDKATLDATKNHLAHKENRFWIEGDPAASLVIELFADSEQDLAKQTEQYQIWLQQNDAYSVIKIAAEDAGKVWEVRKAGLGLLMGKRSRKKAVAVIEDAAVPVARLAEFYRAVEKMLESLGVKAVFYGHASVGLIHIRPELDLADKQDRAMFGTIGSKFSSLVKSFNGALSGEHGDGRLRAPFLKEQVGAEVYQLFQRVKKVFDPQNSFNPGVILSETPITKNHRADRQPKDLLATGFDWRADISLMDAVEKCNGAGACRKSTGAMCPSYQATRNEADSTRGRANLLRIALTEPDPRKALTSTELQDALANCLSCKACKSECPASVDMARLKAEVAYQLKPGKMVSWALKNQAKLMAWSVEKPKLSSWLQNLSLTKKLLKVDPRRNLPPVGGFSLQAWWQGLTSKQLALNSGKQKVWVLADLYSQYQEPEIGQAVLESLLKLGFDVRPIFMQASPRSLISNGLLQEAAEEIQSCINMLSQVDLDDYIIGIEPAETLTWRDEAKDLLPKTADAFDYSQVRLYEELLMDLVAQKRLPSLRATKKKVWLQVHCHQESLAKSSQVVELLTQIPDLVVHKIASGCCGMAGDFGYKNYDLSVKVAQNNLLPALEQMHSDDWVVATGTSCRTQVKDLVGVQALHPAQIINDLLPVMEDL